MKNRAERPGKLSKKGDSQPKSTAEEFAARACNSVNNPFVACFSLVISWSHLRRWILSPEPGPTRCAHLSTAG